jgi:hypothetical protein
MLTLGLGGVAPATVGFGVVGGKSNAASISDQTGWSGDVGASAGQGVGGGVDAVFGTGSHKYAGWQGNAGAQLNLPVPSAEMHGMGNYSWMLLQFGKKKPCGC